jgi:hypothetical protein
MGSSQSGLQSFGGQNRCQNLVRDFFAAPEEASGKRIGPAAFANALKRIKTLTEMAALVRLRFAAVLDHQADLALPARSNAQCCARQHISSRSRVLSSRISKALRMLSKSSQGDAWLRDVSRPNKSIDRQGAKIMNNPFNTPAKLPMWRTVLQAEQAMIKNLPELIRLSRMWVLLTIPGFTVVSWLLEQPMIAQTTQALNAGEPSGVAPIRVLLVRVLIVLINLPALASMAVAWHRLLLSQEHVGSSYLRLDRTVIRYGAALLLIELISPARILFT